MIPLRVPRAARPATGVLLLNLGGPDSLEAVEPFLVNLFSDPFLLRLPLRGRLRRAFARMVARRRAPHVRKLYAEIGGRSPIGPITERQAQKLEAALGSSHRCYVAFSAWRPYIRDAVERAAADGCRRLVGVSLFPQWCSATTASVFHDLRREAGRRALPLVEVDRYPDDPLYLGALASTALEALRCFPERERGGVHVVFSAHGVPVSIIAKGDPYERDIHRTVEGVVRRLPPGQPWSLSYQSKVGPVRWLEPATQDHLRELARRGERKVLVVPVAFVSDHIETLHEQRILLRGVAEAAGIERYEVANALNDCGLYACALARLVAQAEERAGWGGSATARTTPNPTTNPTPNPTTNPNANATPTPNATPNPNANANATPNATTNPNANATPNPNATTTPNATPTPNPSATPIPTATLIATVRLRHA